MKRQIKHKPVSKLVPYARNPRTHDAHQIDQIAASIREWGFTVPVIIDEKGTIIAGHGRVLAAQKLELKEVPTITVEGWTDAQKHAYVIADNKIALNSGWDTDVLSNLLAEIEGDFDLGLTGFSEPELEMFTAVKGGEKVDDPLKEWVDMPEYEQSDETAWKTIRVHLKTPEDLESLAEALGQKMTLKTKYVWHPYVPNDDASSVKYVED